MEPRIRYSFSLMSSIRLGESEHIRAIGFPDIPLEIDSVRLNIPCAGYIHDIKLAIDNTSISFKPDPLETFDFENRRMFNDSVIITPQTRMTLECKYMGFTPPGFIKGTIYNLIATFYGFAVI